MESSRLPNGSPRPLPECRQLFFLATLQPLSRFLIMPLPRFARCEKRRHR
jgi:hypothetical protein